MARYQFKRSVNIDSVDDVEAFVAAARGDDHGKANVVKIVIGPSPGGSTEGWDSQELARLSDVEWYLFPNLTHLYLWSITGLKRIGPLPVNLECLDLRGCRDLESLPAKLPGTLETLDLEGCVKLTALPEQLPTSLAELYLQDCATLASFAPVRALLDQASPNKTGQASPAEPDQATDGKPNRLRRLVLHGAKTPELPQALRGERNENVAARVLKHYADLRDQPTGYLAECKVIVLGNGGMGKTSLVKALIGDPHDPDQGATDKIRLWRWKGDYQDERFTPFPKQPDVEATINIWDFGGQDLYHNTHRVFLETGAVFVVVWRPRLPDNAPARKEHPNDTWYGLDYWLDQILIPNPNARVVVVQTHADEHVDAGDWKTRVKVKYRNLPDFVVGCPEKHREAKKPEGKTLRDLRSWLREAIRKELGSLEANHLPKAWVKVRERLAPWQPTSVGETADPPRSQRPTMRWNEFYPFVVETYRELEAGTPTAEDLDSLVRYLHDIGAVFFPKAWRTDKDRNRLPVVIDQRWAIEGVYVMESDPSIRSELVSRFGEVARSGLNDFWKRARPGSTPDDWWVWEQFMMAAGIMVDATKTEAAAERRYVFPDFMPSRQEMEGGLAAIAAFSPEKTDLMTTTVERADGQTRVFDKAFACRLVDLFRHRVRDEFGPFKFGGIIPFNTRVSQDDAGTAAGNRRPPIVATVEWKCPKDSPIGEVTVDFRGDLSWQQEAGNRVLELITTADRSRDRFRLGNSTTMPSAPRDDDEAVLPPRPELPAKDVERALIAGVAPEQRVIRVAISYAGDDDQTRRLPDEQRREFVPNRIKELIEKVAGRPCDVLAYRAGTRSPHRHLPTWFAMLAEGAIVIAVVSEKYLASRFCMEEFVLATQRGKPWDKAYPAEVNTRPEWASSVWMAAIDQKLFETDAVQWANEHYKSANARFKKLRRSLGRTGGLDTVRRQLTSEIGGRWQMWVVEKGVEQVANVLVNMRCDSKTWNDNPPEKMAQMLADEALREVRIRNRTMSPEDKRRTVDQRMRKAWNGGMYSEACTEFSLLLELIQDQADKDHIAKGETDDEVLRAIRERWLVERQSPTD